MLKHHIVRGAKLSSFRCFQVSMRIVAPLGGGAVRCGQEHMGLCNVGSTSQPPLSEHVTLIGSVWPNSSW